MWESRGAGRGRGKGSLRVGWRVDSGQDGQMERELRPGSTWFNGEYFKISVESTATLRLRMRNIHKKC